MPPPVSIPDEEHVVDVAIIGGGPAGLAAGVGAREAGARDVYVFDREEAAGGILNQCIHSGFGLHYFQEELTGPEYAQRFLMKALSKGVHICTSSYVMNVETLPTGDKKVRVLIGGQGVKTLIARSVVLAMGCRERSRAAIKIAGDRPSGVFTAGLAQKFVNCYGHLPGKRIVILGSGDIGLIMARRMTLEHCQVLGVYEIMPVCNGLKRNVVQCLEDYHIPLHLSHTVVRIHGKDHLEKVTIAPVNEKLVPDMSKAFDVECDCLLLSVGLIPDNEVSRQMGVEINPRTNGPVVSASLETNKPGVFACGNVLQVHDLVDNVSAEGLLAGRSAAHYALHRACIQLVAGPSVGYVNPATLSPEMNETVSFRVRKATTPALVKIGDCMEAKLPFAIPSEMVRIEVPKEKIQAFLERQLKRDDFPANGICTIQVDVVEDTATLEAEKKAKEAGKGPALKEGQEEIPLTCICCPHGCQLRVIKEGDKVIEVRGNGCSRGAAFGEQEVIEPRRVFSTTVAIKGAICGKIPVKLSGDFPKDKLVEAAAEIQKLELDAPVYVGQVLIRDLCGEKGVNVLACRTFLRAEDESRKYLEGDHYVEPHPEDKEKKETTPAPKEGKKDTIRIQPLLGSIHKAGVNAKLLEAFVAGATEAAAAKGLKADVQPVDWIARKKISPCTYCGACRKKDVPGCIIKDDMHELAEHFLAADIIVSANPVWFFGMPSQAKSYFDRLTQIYTAEWGLRPEVVETVKGLTFASIATCGGDENVDALCSTNHAIVKGVASFTPGCKYAGELSFNAEKAGTEEALAKAKELGKKAVETYLA
jgi:NADPH-dependent 2,4-dienoyl-CoA reductase/sulfur reductase-like enzyme/CxxC motif-containing protein/multimeric flavodoxin WrbA